MLPHVASCLGARLPSSTAGSEPRHVIQALTLCRSLAGMAVVCATATACRKSSADAPIDSQGTVSPEQRRTLLELRHLSLQNRYDELGWHLLATLGPVVVALVAVFTFILAWRKQSSDLRRERAADRDERERDSVRRLDGDFTTAVSRLGESSESHRVSAAAALTTFVKHRNTAYLPQVAAIVAANLRIPQTDVVRELLMRCLVLALRSEDADNTIEELNLVSANLTSLDLSNVTLRGASVDLSHSKLANARFDDADLWKVVARSISAEGASFKGANLGQAILDRMSAPRSNFSGSRLASASLRWADLRNARFRGCSMQSAHLDNADLRGATFLGSNIADAYFFGAVLDDGVLESIGKSSHYSKAHFDDHIWAQLRTLR